jgi:hypothetical protein
VQNASTSGAVGTTNGIVGQDITISGSFGKVENIAVALNDSAFTIAAEITSREPETGVTADAITEVNLAVTTSGTVSFDVFTGVGATTGATIDATRETITAQVGSDLDDSALVSEINKKSGKTGKGLMFLEWLK